MTTEGKRKNANKSPGRGPGKPFEPGTPGKPKGARHAVTKAVEALLEGEAQEITRKVAEAAKGGDLTACRLILERILPPAKDRPIALDDMPDVTGAEDVTAAMSYLIAATADGTLTPSEAAAMAGLLEQQRRAIELHDIEQRLAALELRDD